MAQILKFRSRKTPSAASQAAETADGPSESTGQAAADDPKPVPTITSAASAGAPGVSTIHRSSDTEPMPLRTDDPHRAARDVAGLAGFNLDDLADQGREQLAQCRQQVQAMLEAAKRDAETIRADAKREGYAEGTAKANKDFEERVLQTATKQAESAVDALRKAVTSMRATHNSWMQQYADTLSQMVIAACDRIVRKKLVDEPTLVLQWTEEALASARSATELTLALHPETLATVAESIGDVLAQPGLPEQTLVVPDETVSPTEIVVRQTGGEIRAGLETQLERLGELIG